MSDQGGLVSALLAVFAAVAGVILALMGGTAVLWRRHRRRRHSDRALRDTLTMGDLVAEEHLAAGFRSEAEDRRRLYWHEQGERKREREALLDPDSALDPDGGSPGGDDGPPAA